MKCVPVAAEFVFSHSSSVVLFGRCVPQLWNSVLVLVVIDAMVSAIESSIEFPDRYQDVVEFSAI